MIKIKNDALIIQLQLCLRLYKQHLTEESLKWHDSQWLNGREENYSTMTLKTVTTKTNNINCTFDLEPHIFEELS